MFNISICNTRLAAVRKTSRPPYQCTVGPTSGQPATYAAAGAGRMLRVHSPDSSTFLRQMPSLLPSWKCDVKSKIRLRQSICVYLVK